MKSLNKQLNFILKDSLKEIERDINKKLTKEIADDLIGGLEATAPVVSGNLVNNFYEHIKKNKIRIRDRMKYWFYVEFGPHSKPSMGFSRRALNKTVEKNNISKLIKKIWK